MLRIISLLNKIKFKVFNNIKTNNFHYILYFTFFAIFAGALIFMVAEDKSFYDSIWWSFITTSTIGYGDMYPITPVGKVIAIFLIITGIGFMGMLTSTICTIYIGNKTNTKIANMKNDTVLLIKNKIDNIDTLSNDDIDHICKILISFKK